MKSLAAILATVLSSFLLSWAITALACNVGWFDTLCGHNVGIPLLLLWVAGLVLLPLAWRTLRAPVTFTGQALAKCASCGGNVSFSEEQCPNCGFKFGA
jgi:hypothetical protein